MNQKRMTAIVNFVARSPFAISLSPSKTEKKTEKNREKERVRKRKRERKWERENKETYRDRNRVKEEGEQI